MHAHAAEQQEISVGDVLISMYTENESYCGVLPAQARHRSARYHALHLPWHNTATGTWTIFGEDALDDEEAFDADRTAGRPRFRRGSL